MAVAVKDKMHLAVNISIGSDTYPRDMIMNMRTASYMLSISRVASVHRLRGIYA
mgnify:CR=1 FL=1